MFPIMKPLLSMRAAGMPFARYWATIASLYTSRERQNPAAGTSAGLGSPQ